MSPYSLIDISSMLNQTGTPIARSSLPAQKKCVLLQDRTTAKRGDWNSERGAQVAGLVVGTLWFVPFLIAYFATSSTL